MNIKILNRAGSLPEDGWYQIEALGEHINHRARVVQVIDDKAVTSIINRFAAEAAEGGEEFPGMRIDKDHLSQVVIEQELVNSTESLGWSMQLRNRTGVPEAKINWTLLGRPLIESKPEQPPVYKFFSTEYLPEECEQIGTRVINKKTYKVVRPLRLDGLSLTNDPNNKGQRPISNREERDESQPNIMKSLLKKLGLAEDASEESGLAALDKITNRATTAESSLATVTAERDELLGAQVEVDLETHKAVIKNRDSWKTRLLADRKGTLDILADLNPSAAPKKPITNRNGAETPEVDAVEGADIKAEAATAKRIKNRADELKAANPRRAFSACFQQARGEIEKAD